MNSAIPFIDLTQRPPRSMRQRLGGLVLLPRILDKGRAKLAKKNGEYNYNSPTVQHLVRFLGLDLEVLLKELVKEKGDGEILEWVLGNARDPTCAMGNQGLVRLYGNERARQRCRKSCQFCREAGSPSAPTLLLLHGFPSSIHMFRDLSRWQLIKLISESGDA